MVKVLIGGRFPSPVKAPSIEGLTVHTSPSEISSNETVQTCSEPSRPLQRAGTERPPIGGRNQRCSSAAGTAIPTLKPGCTAGESAEGGGKVLAFIAYSVDDYGRGAAAPIVPMCLPMLELAP